MGAPYRSLRKQSNAYNVRQPPPADHRAATETRKSEEAHGQGGKARTQQLNVAIRGIAEMWLAPSRLPDELLVALENSGQPRDCGRMPAQVVFQRGSHAGLHGLGPVH